jgi:cupin fold WbuC family metalloprotein
MNIQKINSEVLTSIDPLVTVKSADVQILINSASQNERKRIRLCAHKHETDRLHEMIIVHGKEAYVRPHKHLNKTESMFIIQGAMDFVIFDENGNVKQVISMGEYASGQEFFFRSDLPIYHTLLIRSPMLTFLETTNGPFNRADTIFAPWSPDGNDPSEVKHYLSELEKSVGAFLS